LERLCSAVDPDTGQKCGARAVRRPTRGPLGGRIHLCEDCANDYAWDHGNLSSVAKTLLDDTGSRARIRAKVESLLQELSIFEKSDARFKVRTRGDEARAAHAAMLAGPSHPLEKDLFQEARNALRSLLAAELQVPEDDAVQKGMVWTALKELGVPAADASKALGRSEKSLRDGAARARKTG
jgi:hypothetical protein